MKNKVNINGVEIEKIIENPQHLGGLVSKFNELLDALDEKKEEPKSTLREAIDDIIDKDIEMNEYCVRDHTKAIDKITSLFKDTLLKEFPEGQGGMALGSIRNIIQNL